MRSESARPTRKVALLLALMVFGSATGSAITTAWLGSALHGAEAGRRGSKPTVPLGAHPGPVRKRHPWHHARLGIVRQPPTGPCAAHAPSPPWGRGPQSVHSGGRPHVDPTQDDVRDGDDARCARRDAPVAAKGPPQRRVDRRHRGTPAPVLVWAADGPIALGVTAFGSSSPTSRFTTERTSTGCGGRSSTRPW